MSLKDLVPAEVNPTKKSDTESLPEQEDSQDFSYDGKLAPGKQMPLCQLQTQSG